MKHDKRMSFTRRYLLVLAAASLLSHFCAPLAFGQDLYPSKPIKLVVPYPPGGANDALGRVLAQKLAVSLKTPVVIENRAGAGGVVGTAFVAKAPADGYTLLIINTLPHTASGSLYKKAPYDPIGDFAPISLIATTPYVLAVSAQSKFSTLQALLEQAKHQPGTINYASGGQGGATHLLMELFKSTAKVEMTHVAYKGGGPAITDLLGGQVEATFENIVAVLPLVKSGKLRALAVSSSKPSSMLPGVPTVAASLKTDFDVLGRFALVAPAGIPQPVLMKLNTAVAAAVQSQEMADTFAKQGIEPEFSTPNELTAAMKSEMALWAKVVNEKGIRLD